MPPSDHPVILFDAECVLCSANARFILAHDKRRRFRFAALRSDAGAALSRAHGVDPTDPATLLVVEDGRARRDGDAVLAIRAGLGWPWRAAVALRLAPRPVRDAAYRLVARNRYRLFGRRGTCRLPDPADRDRPL